MSNYKPPFTLTGRVVSLVAEITEAVTHYIYAEKENLKLRGIHRIQSIQGSLAIEGNTLTTDQVTAILEGKQVIAPMREIQEVRNAIKTYDMLDKWSASSVNDLLEAHATLTAGLIDEAGMFRSSGVGVVSGDKVIHMAPPAGRVPDLITDLLSWVARTDEHPLIASSVFHYEFEFIHPFADGNGRIGRLWQTLLLSRWKEVFAWLPVENMIYKQQQGYYDAINESSRLGDSAPFIEFMLGVILNSLTATEVNTQLDTVNEGLNEGLNEGIKLVYDFIEKNPNCRIPFISKNTAIPVKTIERHVKNLRGLNKIEFVGSKKTGGYYIKKVEKEA